MSNTEDRVELAKQIRKYCAEEFTKIGGLVVPETTRFFYLCYIEGKSDDDNLVDMYLFEKGGYEPGTSLEYILDALIYG